MNSMDELKITAPARSAASHFDPHGIILVDKPSDWTSHDVCGFVRKRFRVKKVGHAGTLDPMATGLLVILLGKATQLSIRLSGCDKEYVGKMELGVATDSHDRQGSVLQTAPWESITLEQVREKAKDFTGEIIQVPPMVSALKYKGKRLYELARKGVTVPREGRQVTVREFSLKEKTGQFISFSACVSKGTYVRTLVHDLGESLGCFATLAELQRVRSGTFHLADAVTVDQLRAMDTEQFQSRVLPLSRVHQLLCGS
jgi:tRNA pseudouridine55 synthase